MSESTERLSTALADRYKILRRIGEGGMATVYLAEDLKHERQVALKLLRPELAAVLGAERFIQEIKTTANLQHPHILPLFDSGAAGGDGDDQPQPFLYYVMPFIDGETLRDKLDRETQLGIDEAVKITTAIADALDYAHRQGVIHRDIKPENILLHDGRPTVADFGIALAVSAAAGGRMTETGLSLGTPHYMSPEQATAEKEITNRSDIYSLGSMLYEMLTGEPPHTGASAQAIIMKIVTEEAQLVTKARKSVPANIAAAVARSLEKLAADRFSSAADFATALSNSSFQYRGMDVSGVGSPAVSGVSWKNPIHLVVTAILAIAVGVLWITRQPQRDVVTTRALLQGQTAATGAGFAISRDSRWIAFGTSSDAAVTFRLLLKRSDQLTFDSLPGTKGAILPGFSPDGKWLSYTKLDGSPPYGYFRILVQGGAPILVADSVSGGFWMGDGSHLLNRDEGLYRVAEDGSNPQLVLSRSESISAERISPLPDGSGALFDNSRAGAGSVMLLDFESGDVMQLIERGSNALYVESGHIIYGQGRRIYAVEFDLDTRTVESEPVAVLDSVWSPNPGYYLIDVSKNGTLIYGMEPEVTGEERLVWVDMDGNETELPVLVEDYEDPRVSPDGRRVAFTDFVTGGVVVNDLVTGAMTRLPASGFFAWAYDSRHMMATNGAALVRVPIDGAGADDTLSMVSGQPFSASADGKYLLYGLSGEARGNDLVFVPLDGESVAPTPYLQANWDEYQGVISPDGQWVAYLSKELGQPEVYVRSFPDPGAPLRISEGGATGPSWAPDGSGVFYVGSGHMMKASVDMRGTPSVTSRTALFDTNPYETSSGTFMVSINARRRYDVDPDGSRFLMVRKNNESFDVTKPMVQVTGWFEELREKMREGNIGR
jgi:Tol biopolymer transport system component